MKTSTEIKSELEALRKQYVTTAQAEFKSGFSALFEKWPQLKSVSWQQYTPYFNDGDTCEFSANTDEPKINGFDSYGDSDDGDGGGENLWVKSKQTTGYGSNEKTNPDYDSTAKKCVREVVEFLKAFEDEIYKDLFDDHVEVVVTPEGIKTEEYNHD